MVRAESLNDRLQRFAARLHSEFGVEHVLVFGSTARGDRLKDSDVDLIIVSDSLAGLPVPERQGMVQRIWDGPEELQALTYTPDEFDAVSKRSTAQQILSYALEITPPRNNICPRCGRKGSPQIKKIKNRSGKNYPYLYYAHYKSGRLEWCYIGRKYNSDVKPTRMKGKDVKCRRLLT
ncbi:MAG: nucleotidyltransferase domain-containing protein [Candidatus Bathyarchaeia archaeon]